MGFLRSLFDGQHGLVWSNVRAYFQARARGEDHRGALERMISSRYGRKGTIHRIVTESMERELQGDNSREEQLKRVIHTMYTQEAGIPTEYETLSKFSDDLDAVISKQKRKHPDLL